MQCFMVHPTSRFAVSLRRYASGSACTGKFGYHNAVTGKLEEVQSAHNADRPVNGDVHPHDDPRWPTKCDHCDYVFTDGDTWQYRAEEIYISEDGREMLLSDRTPGMMYFVTWRTARLSPHYESTWKEKRPPLQVVCPNGKEWCVDAISSNGDGWVVTGEPPSITCSPSIAVPGYHGFLQNGIFTADIG